MQVGDVEVHFVSIDEITQLHAKFFNDPTPTDCISLPIDPPGPHCQVLGEVFVCPDIAKKYAHAHQLDPSEECTLYVVHGLLHLIGYDDIEEQKRKKMRAAEMRHMSRLKQKKLILKLED